MSSMLVDTHCHLNFKVFRSRVGQVVERAREAGVEQMIVVGTKLKSSARAVKLAQEHPELFAAVGIHPHHVWEYLTKAQSQVAVTGEDLEQLLPTVLDEVVSALSELLSDPHAVAVGEIGLDYHWYEQTLYENKAVTDVYKQWQRAFFVKQVELANQFDRAIVVHNREAVTDLLDLLNKHAYLFDSTRVVLHCCEPDQRLLDWVLAGSQRWLGVDGDVTFDQIKQGFIKAVPLEKLVLETDAPYITPEPDRSKFQQDKSTPYHQRVCEPRHVAVIAQAVADLHGVSINHVAEQTTQNARALFDLSW